MPPSPSFLRAFPFVFAFYLATEISGCSFKENNITHVHWLYGEWNTLRRPIHDPPYDLPLDLTFALTPFPSSLAVLFFAEKNNRNDIANYIKKKYNSGRPATFPGLKTSSSSSSSQPAPVSSSDVPNTDIPSSSSAAPPQPPTPTQNHHNEEEEGPTPAPQQQKPPVQQPRMPPQSHIPPPFVQATPPRYAPNPFFGDAHDMPYQHYGNPGQGHTYNGRYPQNEQRPLPPMPMIVDTVPAAFFQGKSLWDV